jgi:hypothetical protein
MGTQLRGIAQFCLLLSTGQIGSPLFHRGQRVESRSTSECRQQKGSRVTGRCRFAGESAGYIRGVSDLRKSSHFESRIGPRTEKESGREGCDLCLNENASVSAQARHFKENERGAKARASAKTRSPPEPGLSSLSQKSVGNHHKVIQNLFGLFGHAAPSSGAARS